MITIAPLEALERVRRGAILVDVRAKEEFEDGHPEGAINVPLAHFAEGRLVDDPSFVDEVRAVVPVPASLVLLCRSGARARRAAALLHALYTDINIVCGGYEGTRGPFGEVLEPGWRRYFEDSPERRRS